MKTYDELTHRIVQDIKSGKVLEENKFPPEPELARTYGVSRGAIRETLSIMEHQGLITRQPRRGTFYCRKSDKKNTILFIPHNYQAAQSISRGQDIYYNMVLQGIREVLVPPLEIEIFLKDPHDKTALSQILTNGYKAAIIPYAMPDDAEHIEKIERNGIHTIVINAPVTLPNVDIVYHDNLTAGVLATKHLVTQGCRKIAFIGLPPTRISAYERFKGYKSVLVHNQLPFEPEYCITVDEYGESYGFDAGKKLLQLDPLPDGIFAANDYLLIGAMRAFLKAGVQIPEQVKTIGYGDYPITNYYHPTLSSIRMDPVYCGHKVAEMAIDALKMEARHKCQCIELPVELVPRESSGSLV